MTSDQKNSILCLKAPSNFRVIAIISTYNEEDIIVPVVEHLREEGIEVYIVDNWSTDSTYEIVKNLESDLCGLERYPQDRPSETYDWEEILDRKEALSKELDADWFMHHDADEIREAPWKDLSLRDAIHVVDQLGYNAIDFALLNFHPVDNNFPSGTSVAKYFQYYEINEFTGNIHQEKAWKKIDQPINLSKLGGHILEYPRAEYLSV